ncbi:RHS repeat domain-containing protein [Stenotrophomonas sp. LGBM10]|uniref:RHS repeat domain-containing protein n=1 Tax=Stenotrophomonas sp. LGBM10 TaxID=3390038 RepID=UPI00398A7CD8
MKPILRVAGRTLLCAFVLLTQPVWAAQPWEEYSKLIKSREQITAEGPQLFGDAVNLYTGELSFAVSEVSIPGNNILPVALGRKYAVPGEGIPNLPMGDWDIDIPYLGGTFEHYSGWNVYTSEPMARCSSATSVSYAAPYIPYVHGMGMVDSSELWHGNHLFTSSTGQQEILFRTVGSPAPPNDGRTYPWLTSNNWMLSCLPTLKSGHAGEGFLAHAPDGRKYHFDWMVVTPVEPFAKPKIELGQVVDHVFMRDRIRLYPSLVEDRNGNWVKYHWAGKQLSRIEASDGRQIDLVWASGRISQVKADGRTWSYTYNPWGVLLQVTQPDGRQWTYDHAGVAGIVYDPREESVQDELGRRRRFVQDQSIPCGWMRVLKDTPSLLRMTHPTGVTGEFTLGAVRNGRTGFMPDCIFPAIGQNDFIPDPPGDTLTSGLPVRFDTLALRAKRIVGSGIDLTWRYDYAPVTAAQIYDCRFGGCKYHKTSAITAPDQSVTVLTYGTHLYEDEGKLLRTEVRQNGSAVRVTESTYVANSEMGSQPFPYLIGESPQPRQDTFASTTWRPVRETRISDPGSVYTTTVEQFDALARPVRERQHNTLGATQTTATLLHDDRTRWILGQTASVTNVDTGREVSRTSFDALARPSQTWSFGQLTQSLTYNADGTVATVSDGNGNVTSLEQWKRAVPRWIRHADGTMKTAAVNDAGWITAVSDENGYVTQYDHDVMGRVTRVRYPADDSVAWNDTTQAFEYIQVSEHGVPAGHWRQTVATGNARKITYFDGLLRPVVTQEYDAADQTGTQRLQLFAHDADGRQTFSSYPVSAFPVPWKGVWKSYDALGRATSSVQDSELGLLVSTSQYLPGGQVRTVNPRAQETLTSYQMFGQPTYDTPLSIRSPEGAVTDISRDVFGKPLAITRRSTDGSQSVTRHYVYSPNQRLCKTVEPETGTTLMDYDAGGNLVWSAAGLDYPSLTACNAEAIVGSGRAVYRAFDSRNRPVHLRFPDNNGNTDWLYTPDGLPSLLTVWNDEGATSAFSYYTYNKRRLLSVETSGQMGWYEWPIAYSYNANGHLAGQVWPSGLTVDYAPDALGQATRVGAFASGVRYYANGGIKQFTYGNGIVHSMQQNERQLPARSTDTGVLDFDTRFDANGNVSDIFDLALGPVYNRHMYYDGLDRLVEAGSHGFGGDAWHRFTYDALDNMKSWTLRGVKDHHYWYDSRNQLTNVRDGAGNTVIGLTYDVQGNLRAKNGVTHSFDLGNRLRGVVGSETYRYDALGRRILASSPAAGNVLSHYAQDGRLVFQSDGRKGVGREFVHLAGSLIAQREYNASGATITYLHTDALGSPVASTNQAGAVVERTHYEPYGAPIGKVVDGPGYTGHVMDGSTGLSYMQQRYMDPQLGVFLSVDPVDWQSNEKHFNRYGYAYNNPYGFSDPDGRIPVAPFIYGAVTGAVADIAVQKIMNPGKPVDKVEVVIAAFVGSVSGGAGGVAIAGISSGSISVGRAIAVQTAVNAAAGGAGSAMESAIKGEAITAEGVATSAVGNAAGGLGGSGIGVVMGDFAGPAKRGTLQRLWQSNAPGAPNSAAATVSTGAAIPRQSAIQAAASQFGQGGAGAGASYVQKQQEKK